MTSVRRFDASERRARLGVRHRVAVPARDVREVADSLVALHGTDPASVFLAAAARTGTGDAAAVEYALYDDRRLVRMLGMRRTMFVLPLDVAPVVHAACTRTIAGRQRTLLVKHLERSGAVPDAASWLRDVEESTLRALIARGSATAAELAEDEPRLRTPLEMATGKPYEARVYVTSRVLFLLAADARIVRGRPRGSWTSSQYSWAAWDSWIPGGLSELDTATAQAELARRWLTAFGPAPATDLRWWTGWNAGETKRALARLDVAEVELDGGTGIVLADDVDPTPDPEPWVALLPALDPTPMGWSDRSWFLGEHGKPLFDSTGNIGPTVWLDGRIVGGWAQRASGEIAFQLLEDVGAEALARVHGTVERLTTWLGPVRVTPRFRTPLERELAG